MKKRAKKKTAKKRGKKKAAKKKPVKKRARKAPRKPAARRAAKKRPKPKRKHPKKHKKPKKKPHKPKPVKKPKPVLDTVILEPLTGPDHVPMLSVSRGDRVRWENLDALDHTLTFTIWPFVELEAPIEVPAGGLTGWFTVDPGAVTRTYSYGIDPAFTNQGPPDPPEVVADP